MRPYQKQSQGSSYQVKDAEAVLKEQKTNLGRTTIKAPRMESFQTQCRVRRTRSRNDANERYGNDAHCRFKRHGSSDRRVKMILHVTTGDEAEIRSRCLPK
ncbi:MAG: hypothetical protein IPN15_07075 [Saprospiraceae bacterium]|nr:hypothetical protein [Candidatus Vicinibacter affinis]